MIHVVYASSAIELFSPHALVELLEACRSNNEKLSVTGMLLYKDGNFIQVLEGEESVIRNLYTKISLDPRHKTLIKLLEEKIEQRDFPNWSMGFKDLTDVDSINIPGYSTFMHAKTKPADFHNNPSNSQRLLLMFRQNM